MIVDLRDKTIHLIPIGTKDLSFLHKVYASTRTEEMKQLPHWPEAMVEAFLKQQFEAQHEYYQNNYIGADFWIIEKNKQPIGRLYVQENFQDTSIRIIDIALLPEWRNKSIGSSILKDLMEVSKKLNRPLTIHVESFNPAMSLYLKLGFNKIGDTNGVYHLMEWKATEN